MSSLSMFIPLTKVDAAQRLVYGIATAESEDRAGEICDYTTSKPLYEKWSSDIHEASNGLSKGNVRAQHGKIAAGKLTEIHFNDEAKQIEICAKIVDDAEWKKVEEGVYTGFSQGGSYAKRWTDDAGKKRYTASPSEVSLVDLPCLPTARFEMIKADGSHEDRSFATVVSAPSNNDVVARAEELAKAAGTDADWASYIEAARGDLMKAAVPSPGDAVEPVAVSVASTATVGIEKATGTEPASPEHPAEGTSATPAFDTGVEQVWKAKDGRTFHKKADAIAHNARTEADAVAKAVAGDVLSTLADIGHSFGIKPAPSATAEDLTFGLTTKADLQRAVTAAEGEKANTLAKRHIRRRAGALDAADLVPEAWRVLAGDAEAGLAKDATLYSVSNLIDLLARIESAENALESASPGPCYYDFPGSATRIQVSKETTDAFGTMLVGFGDMVAKVLDEILTQIRGSEAEEALARAFEAGDLAKAGRRHSASDQSKIQAMHDSAVDLGATCATVKAAEPADLTKGFDVALEKMREERDANLAKFDALQKVMSDNVMPMLKAISEKAESDRKELAEIKKMVGDQPVPLPLVGRAVTKNGVEPDEADRDAGMLKQFEALSAEEQSRFMIKAAQQRPMKMGA